VASTASGVSSAAFGAGSTASGDSSLAMGAGALADGTGGLALGSLAQANGTNAIAIGTGAISAANAVVIGPAASDNGFANAVVLGAGAQVAAVGNTAIGNGAIAIGTNAVAFGEASTAAAAGATAIGRGASVVAGATNAVAIGHGSLASAPNTVSFGSPGNERRLTNVAAGVAPTDAATVGQLSSVSAGFQSQIAGLQTELTATRREARAGAALALAATGLQYDPRPGRASLAAAFGHYKDQAGLAVGIGYAVSDRLRINAAFTGAPDVSDYGVVAGASFTLN
ncbi:hypothetical protein CH338_30435, partial [Rhodoplanes elegans]